jgi:hypothetical protein
MKKITARIDKKTGQITLETSGFTGEACLEATRKLREQLRIETEPTATPEFFQSEEQAQQQQGT